MILDWDVGADPRIDKLMQLALANGYPVSKNDAVGTVVRLLYWGSTDGRRGIVGKMSAAEKHEIQSPFTDHDLIVAGIAEKTRLGLKMLDYDRVKPKKPRKTKRWMDENGRILGEGTHETTMDIVKRDKMPAMFLELYSAYGLDRQRLALILDKSETMYRAKGERRTADGVRSWVASFVSNEVQRNAQYWSGPGQGGGTAAPGAPSGMGPSRSQQDPPNGGHQRYSSRSSDRQ